MAGVVVDASPPKSGCNPWLAPIQLMRAVLFVSTGAALTSRFHQLSGGKRGSGAGSGPPCTAWPRAGDAPGASVMRATRAARRSAPLLEIAIHVQYEVNRTHGVVLH